MRWLTMSLLALPLLAAEPPQRVVSLNLLTDQYVVEFSDPGQVLAVSWLAADPRWSAVADRARTYRLVHGTAEEIVLLRPDLVLAGRYTTPAATAAARRLGLRVVEFDLAEDFETIAAQMKEVGELLGSGAFLRAQAAAARLGHRLDALRRRRVVPRRVLSFGPSGWVDGAGTLADAVIRAAGHGNAAAEAGLTGLQPSTLEELLVLRPDVVLVPVADASFPSLAEMVLAHPAWRRLCGESRIVSVPGAALTAGSEATVTAAEVLQHALDP